MSAAGGKSRVAALSRVGATVLAMAALGGAASLLGSDGRSEARPTSDREPLTDVVLVCPESVAGQDGEPNTEVSAVSAPLDVPRPSGTGKLWLGEMAAGAGSADSDQGDQADGDGREQAEDEGEPRDSVTEAGQGVATTVRKTGVLPIVAHGTGPLAPALGASARTTADSGGYAGLAETGCDRPGSEFWFVGASGEEGRHSQLYLTNIENTDARVTLTLWDSEGQVNTDQVRGVDIAAGGRLKVDLGEVAPLSSELAIRVSAERGRVAAGLLDRTVESGAGVGLDWLGSSTPPARSQLIPGVVPGKGARELTVAAPGDSSATVELALLGENGEFRPAEPSEIQVEAGTVAKVNLASATAQQASAVRLTSDVPVTGSLRSVRKSDSDRDFGYSPAVRPWRTAVVSPSGPVSEDQEASLILSNPGSEKGQATVRLYAPNGEERESDQVRIPAGATTSVDLPTSKQGYTVAVEPQDSALIGSRVLTDGAAVTAVPLSPAPLDALRPVVEPDSAAGLG